jgi:hypothetical protein
MIIAVTAQGSDVQATLIGQGAQVPAGTQVLVNQGALR